MTDSQKAALVALIKLVADAAKDTAAVLQPGQAILAKLMCYENLITDVEALIPQVSGVTLAGLTPANYIELAGVLVADLALTNEKAVAIVQASIDLATELAGPVLYKTQALIKAVQA